MGVLNRLLPGFAAEACFDHDRREDPRVTVALTGRLSTGGCDEEVSVVNLSSGGAMLETAFVLRVGERSLLSIDGWGSVPVVVRWIAGCRAGVAFDR